MESSQVRRLIELNKDEITTDRLTSLQEETVYIKEAAHRTGIKHVHLILNEQEDDELIIVH